MSHEAMLERTGLADALIRVGPDAPTLCGDWDAYDLAAHLAARERRPSAAPGLLVSRWERLAERARQEIKQKYDFTELVDKLRTGPPRWSPLGLPGVEAAANIMEFYIHHEDIIRAQPDWIPRVLSSDLQDILWRRLQAGAKLMLRSAPCAVRLVTQDGRELVAKSAKTGLSTVTVRGAPSELILFCTGRQLVARVDLDGAPEAIAELRTADFGL